MPAAARDGRAAVRARASAPARRPGWAGRPPARARNANRPRRNGSARAPGRPARARPAGRRRRVGRRARKSVPRALRLPGLDGQIAQPRQRPARGLSVGRRRAHQLLELVIDCAGVRVAKVARTRDSCAAACDSAVAGPSPVGCASNSATASSALMSGGAAAAPALPAAPRPGARARAPGGPGRRRDAAAAVERGPAGELGPGSG